MRRKDRERDSKFALAVIRDCEYATLATVNPDETPYCIPISPVLIGDTIYFHCALEGKKLANIKHNPAVCISAVRHTKLVPKKFTTEFESAVAEGICTIITGEDEKIAALQAICEKYAASNMGAVDALIAQLLEKTGVCKIEITGVTGKENAMQ